MKNKWIGLIIGIVALGAIVMVVMDTLNSRTGKRGGNPYKLEVDKYYEVDPALILYKETQQVKLGEAEPHGIAYFDQQIFVVLNQEVVVLNLSGQKVNSFSLEGSPRTIHVNQQAVFVGFDRHVMQYYADGRLIKKWEDLDEKSVITSISSKENKVFVADAGLRRVLVYDSHGEQQGQIEGKRNVDDLHGFVIPSPNFDVATYQDELWVVNPGAHALENYTDEGELRGYWEKTSMKIEGFSGCCNPAQMTIDSNGNFITGEKGMVRIKIYKASGELIGVVAPPDKFAEGEKAPEPVVTESGTIIALDYNQKQIRFFERK